MAGIITDPIGDLLIRIKNGNQRKHKSVVSPFSKNREMVLEILKKDGFIHDYKISGEIPKKEIEVILKYSAGQRAITGVKRISKPGLKVYVKADEIPRVLSGFGTAIVSTSKGMVTDREARKLGLGGKVIAYVW